MIAIVASLLAVLNPVDVAAFAAGLPAKIDKDEARFRLFGVAINNKSGEIAGKAILNASAPAEGLPADAGLPVTVTAPHLATIVYNGTPVVADVGHAKEFSTDMQAIFGTYVQEAESAGKVSIHNFMGLFGHSDPFKDGREQVRAFAAKWDLDPAFREAMG